MSYQTMTLFHGTNNEFDEFDEKYINSRNDTASNSALGFWFFTQEKYAKNAGKIVLTVEANIRNPFKMDIDKLVKLNRVYNSCPDEWIKIRKDLVGNGFDAIELVEIDGRSFIYVVLKPELLKILSKKYSIEENQPNMT